MRRGTLSDGRFGNTFAIAPAVGSPRRSSVRLLAVALLAAVLAVFASGCGDTVIDEAKAEDAVQQSLEDSLDKKVDSVDCPSDEKVEAGRAFSCAVTLGDGQKGTATLLIRNDDADVKISRFKPIPDGGAGSGE
jgi:hypothetical protein